jgi:hypothetical protein
MIYPVDSVEHTDARERRVVAVRASYQFILEMMFKGFETHGRIKTVEGLPQGAKLIREYFDEVGGCLTFIFRHKSFDEVEPGCAIPVVEIVIHTIYEAKE